MALDYGIVPFFALVSLIILIVYVIIWRLCVWCIRRRKDRRLKLSRVSSDDLLRESPSSSGSSWWKNIISKPGSLLEKLGLGRLSKLFRRKHTVATTIVDESGHVIGELSKTTTKTPHEQMTISPQHGGASTSQRGGMTTTSSQRGGLKGPQRIIHKDGGSETQTIIQGEGTEGDEEFKQQIVEEEKEKNDK